MPTIWGTVDRVDASTSCVQVKAALSGRATIRVRAIVTEHTLIVRGIERIDLSSLREGDFVEIAYCHGREGAMEAETISVRSDGEVWLFQGTKGEGSCSGFARS